MSSIAEDRPAGPDDATGLSKEAVVMLSVPTGKVVRAAKSTYSTPTTNAPSAGNGIGGMPPAAADGRRTVVTENTEFVEIASSIGVSTVESVTIPASPNAAATQSDRDSGVVSNTTGLDNRRSWKS